MAPSSPARFSRFELRTTDVEAARSFYDALLGPGLPIAALPAEARARGAPAHWLGQIGVDDVERSVQGFVELGALRLGPTRSVGGGETAILRDPGGAVVAVSSAPDARPAAIVWHSLQTTALAKVTRAYGELFGWVLEEPMDMGELGRAQRFAWRADGPSVGSIVDVTGRPGIHPHWLFHFEVDAFEPSVDNARALGALVLPPIRLPGGDRVAVCDDPQGAAFALREAPR